MKKILTRVGILFGVFVAACIIFSLLTNKDNMEVTQDMSVATLPRVTFLYDTYTLNSLSGYTEEMNVTTMRDSLTLVNSELNQLDMQIVDYGTKVKSASYVLLSLDGTETYIKGDIDEISENMTIDFGDNLPEGTQGVLVVTLQLGDDQTVNYYTRVESDVDHNLKECLDFAQDFHLSTFAQEESSDIGTYLETNVGETDNSFQTVTIGSEPAQVTWGDLEPQIIGDISWSVKDSNSVYSSILLEYQVSCKGDMNEAETYNVKEFFRIRDNKGTMYLLDYKRTMNQMFDGNKEVIDGSNLVLGIRDSDVQYLTNSKGTIVSFVQENELWSYAKDDKEAALIFSFAEAENNDVRNRYDQHGVKIISMDNNGDITFSVYGYMNRGKHEGQVGVSVYFYNREKNNVEELAFIPSQMSYAVAKDDFSQMVYYNHSTDLLYMMVEGTLYKVAVADKKEEKLVTELKSDQYVLSTDGHMIAYQADGTANEATKVNVMNLKTGKEYTVESKNKDAAKPLGFINDDFICGYYAQTDSGSTVSGDTIYPMYQLEIYGTDGKSQKTYKQDKVWIDSVSIENEMLVMNRVQKSGSIYTSMKQDYITNNEKTKESNISLGSFSSELKGTEMEFTYADGISESHINVLKPKQSQNVKALTMSVGNVDAEGLFYVYGMGEMLGSYTTAGYAINAAKDAGGVATTSSQLCIWEKGNRDLSYSISGAESFKTKGGENTLQACVRQMLSMSGATIDVKSDAGSGKSLLQIISDGSEGEALNLTGCDTEDLLYVVNQGTPVVALTSTSTAVLITGYNNSSVYYYDPGSGKRQTTTTTRMDKMTAGSGHAYLSYVKK